MRNNLLKDIALLSISLGGRGNLVKMFITFD